MLTILNSLKFLLFSKELTICHTIPTFDNTLPDNKTLALSKLEAFANDKLNVTQNIEFVLLKVENIVGLGEKLVYGMVSFFHGIFKSFFFSDSVKRHPCVVKNKRQTF